jgi:hypothetical protein
MCWLVDRACPSLGPTKSGVVESLWVVGSHFPGKKILLAGLETGLAFSSFFGVPGAVMGPAETGAGGVRRLLVSILLNGGFGYENL